MSNNSNAFNKAIKLHQTGKLEEAIKIYIKLLKNDVSIRVSLSSTECCSICINDE